MTDTDIIERAKTWEPVEDGDYAYVLLVRTDHEGDQVIAVARSLDGAKAAATGDDLLGSRHLPEGWQPEWHDTGDIASEDDHVLLFREYVDRSDRPSPPGARVPGGPIDQYVIEQRKTIP